MSTALNYIRFWGVRGSYPAPFGSHLRVGGNTSCVELRVDNHILICDGGTGIIPLGNALMGQQDIREVTIILTHYHWDHISGLPFFVPAFVPGWKVNFFGPGDNRKEIEKRISGQMVDPYFPVEVEMWLANIQYIDMENNELNYGPYKISSFNVHHPGSTFGYRIEVKGKTIIYASDNELSFIDQNIESRKDEMNEQEHALILAMQAEERTKALEDIRNANIFIHDAQYTPEDYNKKRGWGHSCYIDTVNFAADADVKQLYLFHVDPNYNDDKIETLHRSAVNILHDRQSAMQCHIAREGLIIDFDNL
ncbi:metal-dependent hydrolase, beta-lactamase superfamily I [Beggiatoa alba B18LD]|uniref:Metal-dependent hydrolase, beta-lactamase superfamily I n=1 Tax=Beggiatoa alba B18LD TaxID=395493 RepID=I3CCN5_9GAMM|nr:MBL fold metallo-hydrolase [Beggiatoa alba]EIJ41378.1 metal-dependent hydrolase, beta-lactamase superfamily I [Beggiatoa alba B18LD]